MKKVLLSFAVLFSIGLFTVKASTKKVENEHKLEQKIQQQKKPHYHYVYTTHPDGTVTSKKVLCTKKKGEVCTSIQ